MFYRIYIIILFIFLSVGNSALAQNSNPRLKSLINEDWSFFFSGKNIEFSEISGSSWENINLPHTWNINDTKNDTTTYKRGIGWYKKNIHLSNSLKEKRVFLHFEGANQIAELFVNGKTVGKHIGGYTAFSFDITNFVNFDNKENKNSIAVKIDNSFNENIPPLSADFTFYGGIYRDVWLIATNPIHFTLNDFGSKAVYISTPEVTNNQGSVRIAGIVQNEFTSSKSIIIKSTIYNNENKIVKRIEKNLKAKANKLIEFDLGKLVIDKPELWSPDHPKLYTVKTELYQKGKLIDLVESTFGFRYFHFDANQGFFLNGKHLKLIGTNRHQDYEGIGNALSNKLHVRDIEMIKEAGFNFLRLAHYPQDPSVLDAADRLGLIIWEEIPIVNYVTASDEFLNNSKYMLKEMIHQHYNHPSIVFWGYMNEVYLHDANGKREKDMFFPEEYLEWTKHLSNELNNLIHKEDNSRLTAIATHQNDLYDKVGISSIPDVVGYNLYQGWYTSRFSDFGNFVDRLHLKYPNRKIIISEYGAGSDERLHSSKPERFDFTTEYQQSYHESYLKQIAKRPHIGASSVWCQSDFGSNRRGDSKPQINQKGLQYFNRKPKDIYYHYQAALNHKPVIRIASHDWKTRVNNEKDGSHLIKIYSNLSEIEIFVDGEIYKTIEVDDTNIAEFIFRPTDCKHNIEVRGEMDGKIISDDLTLTFISYSDFTIKGACIKNEIAINVGANNQFTDSNGSIWVMDQHYEDNSWGYIDDKSKTKKFKKGVIGSENDPIYQFYREDIKSYHFDVEKGTYEIEIYFAEFEFSKAGDRIMDIVINNKKVWKNLDLAKEFGKQTAVSRKFKVLVNNPKGIDINIIAIKGKTILSGIRIKRL